MATAMEESHAVVEHGDAAHAGPEFIFGPGGWVGLAMFVFLVILIWKGVHKIIAGGLDKKIAEIRSNLDEAKQLRAEADALREEYAAKIAGAEKDAEAMLENAKAEADGIIAKAKKDTTAAVARREKMAAEKIAAAERAAVDSLRAKAAEASTAAAAALIADRHDAAADSALADKVIADI
ncbi:hypothetical protein E5222_08495 [Alteraurantiacibacter aquimixticola]|uniref:ATP synthase subunit b n=2 Tax=Alteraurantiacibacter aquimixticola TaxID=2489173 RepID=A0A4T3F1D1_9SPHN|nr:hypothetical protein E5222_08495 [Alteraurantiacibacter aquimixticola]